MDTNNMSQLKYVLEPQNSLDNLARSGEETYRISGKIKIIEGKYGSVRLQKLSSDGTPICGIHMVGYNEKNIVATIYTLEGHRRLGHASQLLDYAKRKYKSVEISDDKTADGKLFFDSFLEKADNYTTKAKCEMDACETNFIAIHTTTSESIVKRILSNGFDLREVKDPDSKHGSLSTAETTPYAILASPITKHSFIEGVPYIKLKIKDKARVLTYTEDSTTFKRKLFEHYNCKDRRDLTKKLRKSGVDVICHVKGEDEMFILNKKSVTILEGGLYKKSIIPPKTSSRDYRI